MKQGGEKKKTTDQTSPPRVADLKGTRWGWSRRGQNGPNPRVPAGTLRDTGLCRLAALCQGHGHGQGAGAAPRGWPRSWRLRPLAPWCRVQPGWSPQLQARGIRRTKPPALAAIVYFFKPTDAGGILSPVPWGFAGRNGWSWQGGELRKTCAHSAVTACTMSLHHPTPSPPAAEEGHSPAFFWFFSPNPTNAKRIRALARNASKDREVASLGTSPLLSSEALPWGIGTRSWFSSVPSPVEIIPRDATRYDGRCRCSHLERRCRGLPLPGCAQRLPFCVGAV